MRRFFVSRFFFILFLFFICLLLCKALPKMEGVNPGLAQDGERSTDEDADSEAGYIEAGKSESEDTIVKLACERVKSIDFTVREYPINTQVYTVEMNRKYKETFLKVLFNQIPIKCEDGEASCFKESDLEINESSDENYIKILKNAFEYYYFDFDGDSLPELIVESHIRNVHFGDHVY